MLQKCEQLNEKKVAVIAGNKESPYPLNIAGLCQITASKIIPDCNILLSSISTKMLVFLRTFHEFRAFIVLCKYVIPWGPNFLYVFRT